MWWTLPFLVFFLLLALFLFLVFQRTTSGSGATLSPVISTAPFNDVSEVRLVEEAKKEMEKEKESPSSEAVAPPAAQASPSDKPTTGTLLKISRKKQSPRVQLVDGVADLAAIYAANEKDDWQGETEQEQAELPETSTSEAALLARHLVEAESEAYESRLGDGDVLAAYRHCRGSAQQGGGRPEMGVYYCNEKADPEHWIQCVINAWSLRQLLGSSIPAIKVIAAPVEPSPWGLALFEVMFPGVAFVASPSAEKCAVADNSLQLWRSTDPAVATFYTVDAALAFKEMFYERVQRPRHTKLPSQVTLQIQKNATITNEFDLAYQLAEVSHMQVAMVDLDKLPVLDQVRLLSNTGILVGMHGSSFVNAVFLPRGAVTVELFAGRYYTSANGLYAASGGGSTFSYHEPHLEHLTSSPQDKASELEVQLASFNVVMQKAVQAWRDNNQLYYHHRVADGIAL